MTTMRQFVGEVLRARRLSQGLTLRDVSEKARVSLGYISEVERGQKEPSSELLAALAGALEVPLSKVLLDVSALLAIEEATDLASSDLASSDLASIASIAPTAGEVEVSAA